METASIRPVGTSTTGPGLLARQLVNQYDKGAAHIERYEQQERAYYYQDQYGFTHRETYYDNVPIYRYVAPDGKLTKKELPLATFDQIDANRDGGVTVAELEARFNQLPRQQFSQLQAILNQHYAAPEKPQTPLASYAGMALAGAGAAGVGLALMGTLAVSPFIPGIAAAAGLFLAFRGAAGARSSTPLAVLDAVFSGFKR